MEIPVGKQEYIKEFVRRTIDNNKNYKGDYEVVNLLNSLLGLIVLINERCKRDEKAKIFENSLTDFKVLTDILSSNGVIEFFFEPVKKENNIWIAADKTLRTFLIKFRNAIAHQHILPINENKKWVGVILWNEYEKGKCDFKTKLGFEQLNRIAIFLAKTYLNTFK